MEEEADQFLDDYFADLDHPPVDVVPTNPTAGDVVSSLVLNINV